MILFADKDTRKIIGKIDGRVHPQAHKKMWIGDKTKTIRIVIPFKCIGKKEELVTVPDHYEDYYDDEGFINQIPVGKKRVKRMVRKYEPMHPQKKLIVDIESGKENLSNYRVDLKTNRLIPRG